MDITSATLEQALDVLGQLLADRVQHYEIVAIGGGSLLLLGQIHRTTKDLDLVALVKDDQFVSAHPLPSHLLQAAYEVGRALQLGKEWLNTGPTSLLDLGLPSGFNTRMQTRHYGGLTIHLAGRLDQICFKLYAAVDQGLQSKHFADLQLLQPKENELIVAKNWCITRDASAVFAAELNKALIALEIDNANS